MQTGRPHQSAALVVSGHQWGKKPDGLDLDQACCVFAESSVFALTGATAPSPVIVASPDRIALPSSRLSALGGHLVRNSKISGDEITPAPAKPAGRNQARMEERRKVIEEYVSSLRKMLERLLKRPH
jgi:hypothetical protein